MVMIKASTLYETILAIGIISAAIAVATLIFSNVVYTDENVSYYQVEELIYNLKNKSEIEQQFNNETINYKEFIIKKKVLNFDEDRKLRQIVFKVFKGKKMFKEYRFLIRENEL